MSIRPSLALVAGLLAAAPLVVEAQTAGARAVAATAERGVRYTFTMTSSDDGDETSRGTVRTAGDRTRIDLQGANGKSSNWLLVTDGGQTVAIVNPQERSYTEMSADKFANIIGTAMRVVDAFLTLKVEDVTVETQRVGPGGTIAGRPTERWALVQEFVVNVGMFGKTTPQLHRVVTDYWIARDTDMPRNPLFEMLAGAETALAQSDRDFVRLTETRRRQLPRGAPMRIVVTSAHSEADKLTADAPKVRRIEVTEYGVASVDLAALRIPAGYERKEAGKGFSFEF